VHRTCTNESKAYEIAIRRFKEARRRFLATETKESWDWYLRGKGNSQNLLFRTRMHDNFGGNGFSDDKNRIGFFRYRSYEILSRTKERRRARRQINGALRAIEHLREVIFQEMDVPPPLRILA